MRTNMCMDARTAVRRDSCVRVGMGMGMGGAAGDELWAQTCEHHKSIMRAFYEHYRSIMGAL